MNFTEIAVPFGTQDQYRLGILTKPEAPANAGIVIIVGGPQYRAGSHRQFVTLARALANAGFAALRIDYRGMGDSAGSHTEFTNVTTDIAAAINAFQTALPGVSQVALWGLCDGASAALLYWYDTQDPRVVGLCLLNPWVRSEASLARTQVKHYYAQRLIQREFWVKLASGRVAVSAISGLIKNVRGMRGASSQTALVNLPFQHKMALAWGTFKGSLLLVLSGEDYTAKEFLEYVEINPQWSPALHQSNVLRCDMKDADHTFSDLKHSREVEVTTIRWLNDLAP
jgi:uncharacterized protein